MKLNHGVVAGALLLVAAWCGVSRGADPPAAYKNFRVAIYVRRGTVQQWTNPQALAASFANMSSQVKFDKVYLEVVTGRQMMNEPAIDAIKKFFTDKGIQVSGACVLNGTGGQARGANGGSLSFATQADRDVVKNAAELCARHFDELILDDWYFTASKLPADIAAKGDKSWTQYRVDALDEASQSLIIKPAHAINPKMHVIIKYPNWYEHYQALGYDLENEPKIFDGIYTGVETRDPIVSEQHLQQYESYNIMRYLENVKPGGNDGGWVDQLQTQYIDRYAEQIWNMAFSKPKEITLWEWDAGLQRINIGTRPWDKTDTSLNFDRMLATYKAPAAGGQATTNHVAGYALEQVDAFLGRMGKPIGIAGYRPPHAIGEEFYYDYLGMAGFPIELQPTFPTDAAVCLLTEGAKDDADIVKKIKGQLAGGKNVIITGGLLKALSGKGIGDISEFEYTDHKVAVTDFQGRAGATIPGSLNPPVSFPVIHFITNQSWSWVSGYDKNAPANGYPIVLSDAYAAGTLYVLNLPDNIADLYRLPPQVLGAIRTQVMGAFPTRLVDAPGQVALFAYDNNAFIVESYLPTEVTVTVSSSAQQGLVDLVSNAALAPVAAGARGPGRGPGGPGRGPGAGQARGTYSITIPAHSFRAFAPGVPAAAQGN